MCRHETRLAPDADVSSEGAGQRRGALYMNLHEYVTIYTTL